MSCYVWAFHCCVHFHVKLNDGDENGVCHIVSA